jgi:hypothetical protein
MIQGVNNQIFINKKIHLKDTLLVVGSPRSGTTWLMELLTTLPEYTYIFEPLNPIWSPQSFTVGFRSRTFLSKSHKWPEGEQYLQKVFTGQISNIPIINNPISDIFSGLSVQNLLKYFLGTKIIVKSVNMNRMLPWIAQHFPLRGIFCIIRHPCAVIASQIRTGLCGYRPSHPPYFDIFPRMDDILEEISQMDHLDSNFTKRLPALKTQEEILAVTWCLDNYSILSEPSSNKWNLVSYEKLLTDEREIENLFFTIGEKGIPKSALKQYKTPSSVTTKNDRKSIQRTGQQLLKWKNFLSEQQIERILKIVSDFGIDMSWNDIASLDKKS